MVRCHESRTILIHGANVAEEPYIRSVITKPTEEEEFIREQLRFINEAEDILARNDCEAMEEVSRCSRIIHPKNEEVEEGCIC